MLFTHIFAAASMFGS